MKRTYLSELFNFYSILPILLVIDGVYILYLFSKNSIAKAFIYMLIGFVIFLINNIIGNLKGETSIFNEYLEDFGSFLTFGITLIIFGINFFSKSQYSNLIIYVLGFYTISIALNLARSWILELKNSMGWPVQLNGLFFPLVYYIYTLYLNNQGSSIFLIYYVLVSILSLSSINFLGYDEDYLRNVDINQKIFDRKKGFNK